jgi:hypothetical protein
MELQHDLRISQISNIGLSITRKSRWNVIIIIIIIIILFLTAI